MKEIALSQGLVALVDDEDFEELNKYRWYAHKPKGANVFYAIRHPKMIKGVRLGKIAMHAEVVGFKGADHIDGNGLNNQKSNLRKATVSQNGANRRKQKGTVSKFKGVDLLPKTQKWRARIMVGWKRQTLGYFDSELEAAKAYDKAAVELCGEFANLNIKG